MIKHSSKQSELFVTDRLTGPICRKALLLKILGINKNTGTLVPKVGHPTLNIFTSVAQATRSANPTQKYASNRKNIK